MGQLEFDLEVLDPVLHRITLNLVLNAEMRGTLKEVSVEALGNKLKIAPDGEYGHGSPHHCF